MSSGQSIRTIVSVLIMGVLTSCVGSSLGDSVQQSLEADPQLEEAPPFQQETAEKPATSEAETSTSSASDLGDTPPNDRDQELIATAPKPGDADFIGPMWPNQNDSSTATRDSTGANTATRDSIDADTLLRDSTDLSEVPDDLQSYIRDLQQLDVIKITSTTDSDTTGSPYSQPISRREYARWLFDSYNAIYADEPGERLRAGTTTDEPAFQDVSPANPDYAKIQGLAEAGIIPSAFSGNSTDVTFRPDAPLTREALILWKVPLDTQAALPSTTPEAVTKTWGFQDTASIDPMALRAIAADFQLGDFANIRRAFGYTTLFRPDKTVSRAEAAAVLWRFGTSSEGYTAADRESRGNAPNP